MESKAFRLVARNETVERPLTAQWVGIEVKAFPSTPIDRLGRDA
jgi:hypothetical protein